MEEQESLAVHRPSPMFRGARRVTIGGGQLMHVQGNVNIHPPTGGPPAGTRSPALPSGDATGDVRTESDNYCSQLLRQGRGFPLYDPGPQINLPAEYQRRGVAIGDVGRVTPQGIFDFFFNIYLPADHPINDNEVPEDFHPLPAYGSRDVVHRDYKPGNYVSTTSVYDLIHTPVVKQFPGSEFSFECVGPRGAVLALPHGAHLEKLENVETMRQYAAENAASWYKYVNGPARGRGLVNGSLYLVTGCEKSLSWGMASFQEISSQNEFQLSFSQIPHEDGGYVYRWLGGAPVRQQFADPPPVYDGNLNQTTFLHAFTISLGEGIWGRLFGGVEIGQLEDSALDNPDRGFVPYGSQRSLLSWSLSFFGGGSATGGQHRTGRNPHEEVIISDASPIPKIFHPSQIINERILQEMPQANVVITHDDDWRDILRDQDGTQVPEDIPPDFLQLIFDHFEITEEDGAAYLTSKSDDSYLNNTPSNSAPPEDNVSLDEQTRRERVRAERAHAGIERALAGIERARALISRIMPGLDEIHYRVRELDVTVLSGPSDTTQSEATSTPVPLDETTPDSPPETRLLTPFPPPFPSLSPQFFPDADEPGPGDAPEPSPYSLAPPPSTKQTSTSAARLRPQENTLIYKNLLSLFHDVNSERNLELDSTLAQYYATMCAGDAITSLIRSSNHRKTLLEFASRIGLTDDQKFQDALQKDDTRLLDTLPVVIQFQQELYAQLTADDAQDVLDVLQNMLQKDLLQKHRLEAWQIMLQISSTYDKLPSSIFMTGVTDRDKELKVAGSSSDIYRAWYDGKLVALKRQRVYAGELTPRTTRLRKLYREALLWHNLRNPYILPLIGVEREMLSPALCLVSPWMEMGTILNYLHQNGRQDVNRLLSEVAQGIQYLHSQNIVHGDLRGNNILITSELTACLGDFGFSSFSDSSEDSTQQVGLTLSERSERETSELFESERLTTTAVGSPRWMAPELLTGISTHTHASDMYAFGCLCVELYTGRIPFSNVSSEAAVMLSVLSGKRPERPTGQAAMSDALWDLVIACWAHDPPSRPSMQTVVENTTAFAGEPESKQAELAPEYGVRKPKKSKELKNITQPGGKRGRASIGKSLA